MKHKKTKTRETEHRKITRKNGRERWGVKKKEEIQRNETRPENNKGIRFANMEQGAEET